MSAAAIASTPASGPSPTARTNASAQMSWSTPRNPSNTRRIEKCASAFTSTLRAPRKPSGNGDRRSDEGAEKRHRHAFRQALQDVLPLRAGARRDHLAQDDEQPGNAARQPRRRDVEPDAQSDEPGDEQHAHRASAAHASAATGRRRAGNARAVASVARRPSCRGGISAVIATRRWRACAASPTSGRSG